MLIGDEQRKQIQEVELEILKVFIGICKKLGLRYYLTGGTLLGAVRHNGFIPWDDDIDVGMPRADYEVFLARAQEFLPEPLFLQTHETDSEYPKAHAKIRNSNTAFIETPIRKQKMNHGIFLDIFPLDFYHSKPKGKMAFYVRQVFIASRIALVYDNTNINKTLKNKVFYLIGSVAKWRYPTVQDACRAKDAMFKRVTDGDVWANHPGRWGEKERMPVEWYGEGVALSFEGIEVTAPVQYHKVLTKLYGDYMTYPPVEERVTLHQTDVIDTEKSFREYL